MLIAGLISAAVAKLPGLVIHLSQKVDFLKLVIVGDYITASTEVTDKNDVKGILASKNAVYQPGGLGID